MSRTSRDKMRISAELVRKGATLMAEPCKKCGGIQLRFHGKVYCTNHEDLEPLLVEEVASYDSIVANLKELLTSKLNEVSLLLEREKDVDKQVQLVSLISGYFELLQKIAQK